jgi:hypothetical protein
VSLSSATRDWKDTRRWLRSGVPPPRHLCMYWHICLHGRDSKRRHGCARCPSHVFSVWIGPKAWNVFSRLNTGIVSSNPARGIDVCVYSVFVLSCVGSGLATGWSLVRGVLPTVYKCKIMELHKEEAKARYRLERHWMDEWRSQPEKACAVWIYIASTDDNKQERIHKKCATLCFILLFNNAHYTYAFTL